MNTWKITRRHLGLIVLSLLILAGCTTTKPAIKLDPSFSEMQIESVALLPIIDRRVDKSYEIDLENKVRQAAKENLEKKGYTVIMPSTFVEGRNVDPAEVEAMGINDLASLGPPDSKAIVLIYIEDILSSYKVLSYAFKIEATASVISKEKQCELWRNKAVGKAGQGGLISGITQGLDRSSAIGACIGELFSNLPIAPKLK
jgi:hypothetical protein